MAINKARKYVYFLYSEEQFKEKNEILLKTGKAFEVGTVVINGTRKKFTQISTKSTIPRFIDTKIIAQGYLDTFTYTEPSISRRASN